MTHACMKEYICIYICIYVYVTGMSILPFQIRVLMFWWENPSLLNYDDVIALCC